MIVAVCCISIIRSGKRNDVQVGPAIKDGCDVSKDCDTNQPARVCSYGLLQVQMMSIRDEYCACQKWLSGHGEI